MYFICLRKCEREREIGRVLTKFPSTDGSASYLQQWVSKFGENCSELQD